ncbi:hypothetical protein C8F01DRAFT_1230160 [Mycena amicta]|nr:hypothetical protein C8F01DRAFT_1230160 [Mycena amicta]
MAAITGLDTRLADDCQPAATPDVRPAMKSLIGVSKHLLKEGKWAHWPGSNNLTGVYLDESADAENLKAVRVVVDCKLDEATQTNSDYSSAWNSSTNLSSARLLTSTYSATAHPLHNSTVTFHFTRSSQSPSRLLPAEPSPGRRIYHYPFSPSPRSHAIRHIDSPHRITPTASSPVAGRSQRLRPRRRQRADIRQCKHTFCGFGTEVGISIHSRRPASVGCTDDKGHIVGDLGTGKKHVQLVNAQFPFYGPKVRSGTVQSWTTSTKLQLDQSTLIVELLYSTVAPNGRVEQKSTQTPRFNASLVSSIQTQFRAV